MTNPKSIPGVFLVTVAFAFFAAGAFADTYIREYTESFSVRPDGSVSVDLGAGNVEIQPGSSDALVFNVLMKAKASSEEKAEDQFNRMEFIYDQDGNAVSLVVKSEKSGSWLFGMGSRKPQVKIVVSCPESFNLNIDTGSGNISATGITGESLVFDTGSGNVDGHQLTGHVVADTGSGNIRIDKLNGGLNADTGSGNIKVTGLDGAFKGDTGSGNISVSGTVAHFNADTGSGNISISSGSPIQSNSVADAGSGNVAVTLPPESAFFLEAETGSGRLRIDFPDLKVSSKSKRQLKATSGTADIALELSTSSGNVSLKAL